MAEKYDHQTIEAKWQKLWHDQKVFVVTTNIVDANATNRVNTTNAVDANDTNKDKKSFVLDMFPYPSGDGLHVGHPEGYTATDIYSRYLRMNGQNVLHPMGWDAFGLPAENAAIKKKTHPRIVTEQNIKNFKRQIQSIGFSYDWDREINTTDPKYYKWTQWIFLQLFKKGLAYEKEAPIWWCPKDKTGLANEEVVGGVCDRCGTKVEKKMLRQWVLKITDYADRLLAGLDKLDWPESIKTLQRNWIGRSEGAEVVFGIWNEEVGIKNKELRIKVFTTRPDTLFGATYIVLSPEHPLVDEITTEEQKKKVESYKLKVASKSDLERTALEKEKTGVFTGGYAVNPVNNKKIPVWIADYVLMSYGTGAIMAVPAHDERDFSFATKFGLPIEYVIAPYFLDASEQSRPQPEYPIEPRATVVGVVKHWSEDKYLLLNWKNGWKSFIAGGIDGGENQEQAIIREIKEETGYTNMKIVQSLGGPIIGDFFNPQKKKNYRDSAHGWFVHLLDDKQEPIAEQELAKHHPEWITTSQVLDYIRSSDAAGDTRYSQEIWQRHSTEDKYFTKEGLVINSGNFDGMRSEEARLKIIEALAQEGKAKAKTHYKLRDWIFSRQRYWGEPIPIVKCASCTLKVESTPHHHELATAEEWQGWIDQAQTITNAALAKEVSEDVKHKNHYVKVTFGSNVGYWRIRSIKENALTLKHVLPGIILVPEKELPLLLPDVEKYEPTGTGESPLAAIDDWVNVTCRVCGHPAKRETNTMPQWAGSCWYYLRFCDPNNDMAFASAEAMKAWLPVDLYVGGAEHAVLHLLYARFWHMVLYDIGAIPKTNDQGESLEEPFRKLKNQGLILGPDGEKMSKSRGNVINPDEIIEKYGADTLRMYEMFMGPFEDAKPWDTNGIVGVRRFLDKVWRAGSLLVAQSPSSLIGELPNRGHKYIKSMTEGIENFRFNTGVSDLMKWVNEWGTGAVSEEEFAVFLKLLSPFAPHITEELWANLGHKTLLVQETWPKFDPKKIKEATVTIAVQVNGKLRAALSIPAGKTQDEVEEIAHSNVNVQKFLTGQPKKVIFVKDRLINFVV